MSFPPPPETWDPSDEYGRAQINEFLANMYSALQRERERVNEIVKNSGIVKPGPFVGHPGQPVLGTCADEGASQCIAVNFSGVPGHIQIPTTTFPLLGFQLLAHWGDWQDRGNGDLYLALFSDPSAGGEGNFDLEFCVPIPRGFTGWATNALVLRYRLAFTGVPGSITAELTVIDTRNEDESIPVEVTSFAEHDEAAGVVDVPYGAELTVTRDQLAGLVGFREGTAIRLRFRVSLPGTHDSGLVGVGHLELNFK